MVIVNAGIWGGKDLQKVPKSVVTFYRLIGLFLFATYRATRSFCHKPFKVWSSKYCSYLRTDKKSKTETKPRHITILYLIKFIIYIYIQLNMQSHNINHNVNHIKI